MIKNYFKIALRNLWKDRNFTFLNVLGITVAFSVAILLSMYALFELSYDNFHENKNSIYQVYSTEQLPDGPEVSTSKPIPFAKALQEEVPGVEKITRFNGKGVLVISEGKELQMTAAYVDPDFFSIFSFPVVEGKKVNPIGEKSGVAISEYAAKRIFGSSDVVGKSITVITEGEERPYTIAAIVKDMPNNSSIKFDLALDFTNQADFSYADNVGRWDKGNHEVYMQLNSGLSPQEFEKGTDAFTKHHYKDEIARFERDGAQPDAAGNFKQIRLFPFKDAHFAREWDGNITAKKMWPYMVLGISLLIILIAGVNFVNMSIAKSAQRLREMGMRKTLGAGKSQLFFQFWGESILVFLASVGLAAFVAGALLESFQTLFRTRANFSSVTNPEMVFGFLLCLLIITLVAGGYPALLLSRLGTIQALKGKIEMSGKNRLRDGLIVIQFGIAILLISGTLVLNNQLEFMRSKDLGFNKDQVVAFALNGKREDAQAIQLIRDELSGDPGIISITASNNILGLGKDGGRSTSVLGFEYKGREVLTNILMVDYDYIETLGLDLSRGRSFNRDFATDSLAVVINETMASQLKEKNVLNTKLEVEEAGSFNVVGVIKDYHFQDLDKEIEPLTLFLKPNWNMRYAYVKVAPQNALNSFDKIEVAWNKIEPNANFTGSFLDENIERTLRRERTMSTLITSGSIIAIILSCIGLFAMSMLLVSQRRKEIGVRKVIGASVGKITLLLTSDFLKLVGIAFLIAAPISWYLSSEFLQNYAFRIDLSLWIFISAGIIALLIAIVTISFKTINAATANPIKSLKTE